MTLSGRFTLNVHYYELPLRNYLLLICCRVCLHLGLHVTSREVQEVEYLESAEKLRIFHRRYIDGTLTNKANISI